MYICITYIHRFPRSHGGGPPRSGPLAPWQRDVDRADRASNCFHDNNHDHNNNNNNNNR